jgi:hypothetical protein
MALKRLKNNREFNNYDLLKCVAFFTMLVDHTGFFIFENVKMLRIIGRTSAPIYAILFGINKKRNVDRIVVIAILMSMAWAHFYNIILPLNIMHSFYISNFFINKLDTLYNDNTLLFSLAMAILILLGRFTSNYWEYGTYLIAPIFCGRIFRKSEKTLKDKVMAAILLIIFFCEQIVHMEFNVIQSVILFLILLATYMTFLNFRFKEIRGVPCGGLLLFISRYSAELFLAQGLIFMAINLWLY